MSTSSHPLKTERGAPDRYEVVWESGHVEQVSAHQVLWPNVFRGGRRVLFHTEIDGLWTLVLSAVEDDIRTVRNITDDEQAPGGAA